MKIGTVRPVTGTCLEPHTQTPLDDQAGGEIRDAMAVGAGISSPLSRIPTGTKPIRRSHHGINGHSM